MTSRKYVPICRHCGRDADLSIKSGGRPAMLCFPCRQLQIVSGHENVIPRAHRPPSRTTPRMAYAEQKARTARAIERSRTENIPMVEALRREGLVR